LEDVWLDCLHLRHGQSKPPMLVGWCSNGGSGDFFDDDVLESEVQLERWSSLREDLVRRHCTRSANLPAAMG